MSATALKLNTWFAWVLFGHWILIIGGVLSQTWLMVPFCMWTSSQVLQLPGGIIWLALTLSPLLGLAAVKLKQLRKVYAGCAIATPLFFVLVMSLNAFEITSCDAL
jgi:hypothetical protein